MFLDWTDYNCHNNRGRKHQTRALHKLAVNNYTLECGDALEILQHSSTATKDTIAANATKDTTAERATKDTTAANNSYKPNVISYHTRKCCKAAYEEG